MLSTAAKLTPRTAVTTVDARTASPRSTLNSYSHSVIEVSPAKVMTSRRQEFRMTLSLSPALLNKCWILK